MSRAREAGLWLHCPPESHGCTAQQRKQSCHMTSHVTLSSCTSTYVYTHVHVLGWPLVMAVTLLRRLDRSPTAVRCIRGILNCPSQRVRSRMALFGRLTSAQMLETKHSLARGMLTGLERSEKDILLRGVDLPPIDPSI